MCCCSRGIQQEEEPEDVIESCDQVSEEEIKLSTVDSTIRCSHHTLLILLYAACIIN